MDEEIRRHLTDPTIPMDVLAKVLGICVATAYTAAKRGDFPTIQIGSRIVVPTAPLRRMLGLDTEAA
jgi:predicted DNA-binding transcriptional regulator AlpA